MGIPTGGRESQTGAILFLVEDDVRILLRTSPPLKNQKKLPDISIREFLR